MNRYVLVLAAVGVIIATFVSNANCEETTPFSLENFFKNSEFIKGVQDKLKDVNVTELVAQVKDSAKPLFDSVARLASNLTATNSA